MSVTPAPLPPEAETTTQATRPKLWTNGTLVYTHAGLVALFCWLLWGDFALSMKDRSVPAIVQLLLKKFEASDTLTGILVGSLPAIIGFFVLPVVGYQSDRHRGRCGRRIPYLLVFTALAVVAVVGLAFSPALGQALHTFLGPKSPGLSNAILIFFSVFWTTFELASIVLAGSLIGAFINDVVPRPLLGRFYGLFRALSLIAGMAFNYWLMGRAEDHATLMFLGVAVLYGVGFTVMCLKVKEGDYPPPPPPQPGIAGGFFNAAKTYFQESFTEPYYWWVFASLILTWMAFVPFTLFSVFFAQSIHMSMDTYGKLWALTYLISLTAAYPLGALADRFHPLRVSGVLIFLYALSTLWGGLYASDARMFAIGLVIQGVLAGSWQTAAASLAQRLFPEARFAQLASAMGIVGGATGVGLPPLVGWLLDHSGHVYRYTFLMSSGLSALAFLATVGLYQKFKARGGPDHYIAPE